MDTLQLDLNKRYTFADYLTWADDKRRELIDGFVKLMSPAPKRIHQETSSNLHGLLWNYLRKSKCKIYDAPFDVRLPEKGDTADNKTYTVVQPDLCIICDTSKLDERGCIGAPDFIIEIISQKNPQHDTETKFKLYEKHKVQEYWIVHPQDQTVNVFILDGAGKYQFGGLYAKGQKIKVNIFDDFYIDLAEVFDN